MSSLAALAVLAWAGAAGAVDFSSFSEVKNVCPECDGDSFDTVEMSDGQKVECNVVAENEDFFVLERYGEVRGVPKGSVTAIEWAEGRKPANLNSQDQIVLNNGHVLTGTVQDESDKPGHFQFKSSVADFSYVVFKTEAKDLYKNGSKVTIEMPEKNDGQNNGS